MTLISNGDVKRRKQRKQYAKERTSSLNPTSIIQHAGNTAHKDVPLCSNTAAERKCFDQNRNVTD
jgi:hypothetical protein